MLVSSHDRRGDRQSTFIVWILIVVTASLVVLAVFGMETLSAVRAYVGGEGLWSKGQKDAAYNLARYATSHDEQYYQQFLTSIAIPLGDHRARLELNQPRPDLSVVYAGFIAGGNDPADVAALASLYRRFHGIGYMKQAIEIWTAGDVQVAALVQTADRLHATLAAERADPDTLRAILAEVDAINTRTTQLENDFSRTLGQAARWVKGLLVWLILVAAAALAGFGVFLSRRWLARIGESESALQQTGEMLRSLIDAAPVAIYSLSLEGEVRQWNPAAERIFGWPADEVLGKSLPYVPPEAQDDFHELLDGIARGQAWTGKVFRRRRRDGTPIEISVSAGPIYGPGRRVAGVIAVAMDVSEVQRLEEQLRQSQKMDAVGRLAGGIAHDFNNILTAISGFTQLLFNELENNEEARAEVLEIKEAAERAGRLTRQLLAFGRKQFLQPTVLNPNVILERMSTMLRRLIPENLTLELETAPKLGFVKVDPGQIEQVLLNLVVNARDAMPLGGTITVRTANVELDDEFATQHPSVRPGPHILMAVSDTGAGIDPETMAHLFEPFFTTKPYGKGTGLGLATVYGIVKQSDGSIWVDSEPGKGTTLQIYLPRVAAPTEGSAIAEVSVTSARGTETILLVEDDEAIRRMASRTLEGHGYRVLSAAGGMEAELRAGAYDGPIHALVTDVVMPGMNGRELAERVTRRWPAVRVLYMSGYTDDSILRHGVKEAEVALLQKPFAPDELARKLREVLDSVS